MTTMTRLEQVQPIIERYAFEGTLLDVKPHGCGHINDTFALTYQQEDGTTCRYILQRVNTNIFKDPKALMNNVAGVIRHIKDKITAAGGDALRETLTIVQTKEGEDFCMDAEGGCWRSYLFIEGAHTYQIVEDPIHLYHSGKGFGKFQGLLADYPAHELVETIPDFHHTAKRYEHFLAAIASDPKGRVSEVADEIAFVKARSEEMKIVVDAIAAGKLPLKVTHNDTKFNNVMIDDTTGEAICVIDLDTVMPGSILYDFGDAIRSSTNTAEEDEADLSKVSMSMTLFEQFTKGFLEMAGSSLTDLEVAYLPFSAKLMTLECGMRFLTDYINGDTYFKIHRPAHNLDRARNQFKLVSDMEAKEAQMKDVVQNNLK